MINQDENFLELTKTKLESKNIYQEFHNFGFAGTGPEALLNDIEFISQKIKLI